MKSKKVKLKKSRGTIAVIAILFLSSAGIRIVSSAEAVVAEAQNTLNPETPTDAAVEEVAPPSREELEGILQAFQVREERVRDQELQLERRMHALQVADEQITKKLAELRKAEEELRATLALASTAAEDDLSRLTTVYENMKPKVAAALFQEMAPEFAAGFLGRMRPDSAAAVMAGMTPETAYSVSAILAGRNANVPKE